MTRILIAHEKHGDSYYDISTPELWALASLYILTQRNQDGFWYYEPEVVVREAADLTDEQIAALPAMSLREQATRERKSALAMARSDAQAADWYARMIHMVKHRDLSMVTVGRGRHERQEPAAWRLLYERSPYEYESVEIVVPETVTPEALNET